MGIVTSVLYSRLCGLTNELWKNDYWVFEWKFYLYNNSRNVRVIAVWNPRLRIDKKKTPKQKEDQLSISKIFWNVKAKNDLEDAWFLEENWW